MINHHGGLGKIVHYSFLNAYEARPGDHETLKRVAALKARSNIEDDLKTLTGLQVDGYETTD